MKILQLSNSAINIDDIALIEKMQDSKGYHLLIYQKSIERKQRMSFDSCEKMEDAFEKIIQICGE